MSDLYSISTANNARLLEPESVAQLFVSPPFFRELFALRHQLLVGPRGSGKTTLLKMLRIRALENWQNADGAWARSKLPFVSIFVPADTSWTERLKSQASVLPSDVQRAYTRAAHTLLLLRAIVEGFSEKVRRPKESEEAEISEAFRATPIDTHREVELCQILQRAWDLTDVPIPTLKGLRTALSTKLMRLRKTLEDEVDRGQWSELDALARRTSLPVSETVSQALDAFEEVTGNTLLKWALLFDELEIMPDWFQEDVLARFRSTDSRIVFKVAITPCGRASSQLGGVKQPHRVDDYEEVPLWYANARDEHKFCEAFWYKLLENRGIPKTTPTSVLGRSVSDDFEPSVGAQSGRYGRSGIWYRHLQSLAKKDASFTAYLNRRGVQLTHPERITRRKMDSVLRKVAPVAIFRDYFLVSPDSSRFVRESNALRARKVISLYSGAKSIFRITEGNPRWYLSLVGQLLTRWERQGRTITRQQQAKAVEAFSERFLAIVAAYPNPVPRVATSPFASTTVTSLLGRLGKHAFSEIVGDVFNEDPRLTFRIDIEDPTLTSLLTLAINAGALVLVGNTGAPLFVDNPAGREVRLSYHLAPHFRIPMRAGRTITLSRALGKERYGLRKAIQQRMDFSGEDDALA